MALSAGAALAQGLYPDYGYAPYGYGYAATASLYDYAAPGYGYAATAPLYDYAAPGYGYAATARSMIMPLQDTATQLRLWRRPRQEQPLLS